MSTAFIERVIALTNQERAKVGLGPLVPDSRLIKAAEGHSEDMALQDYFSHTGLNGSRAVSRAAAFGFTGVAAENIAAGQPSPEQVVAGWMNSPSHRRNILAPDSQSIGVGYFFLANDTGRVNYHHYWVQIFGRTVGNNLLPDDSGSGSNGDANNNAGNNNAGNNYSEGEDLGEIGHTVMGTDGQDTLVGTPANDLILGRGGHDFVQGRQGNDLVSGETGNDTLRGGKGFDRVSGGDGNDWLYGDRENDTVMGGNGDDTLHGGKGNDSLVGDVGSDILSGDVGRDTLIGGMGWDTYVLGGDTFDIVFYTDGEDSLTLPIGLTFSDLMISQGLDEFVKDGQIETLLTNRNTGQLLAVLPGIETGLIGPEDFIV
ncbi:CAP domain-containing protein [Trichothermofontia sp.]